MNIQEMMRQAKVMQKRMEEMQAKLSEQEVDAQSGGGLVHVTMTCRGELRRLMIDPSVINPNDKETLEDLIMAAVNSAREAADKTLADETSSMMREMGLPANGKLPF